MAQNKKNFYVVKAGREIGIFRSWDLCKKSVMGYSGAVYKGFVTLQEAEDYLAGGGQAEAVYDATEYPVVYVDGSFDLSSGIYSYGAVFLLPDGEVKELSGVGDNPEMAVERNIAGELMGAMESIKYAYAKGYAKILIKHDYEGIARWAKGEWKANKFCSNNYINFLKEYQGKLEVFFEKVPAHAGVQYNELVDKLAKKAIQDYKAKLKLK